MGTITFDGLTIEFDDRVLAHLQIVIVQKFRAGEALLMSWLDPLDAGDGRSSVWLTPEWPVQFKFFGSRVPEIDRTWLDQLTRAASSGPGLIVRNEHGELIRAGHRRELTHRR